jgi:steroid delta-isomerase-like uncharacterized protein
LSAEDNKSIVRRGLEETMNQKNLAVLDELLDSDFTFHSASRTIPNREAFREFLTMFLNAFPDLHFTIEDIIAEGDKVSLRYTYTGTHQGEFMGNPPTGKQITVRGLEFIHVRNGKILEEWINEDFFQQIAAVLAPE